MSEYLTARMQHIVAVRSDAVDVVARAAEPAVAIRTGFVLHVFLETVFGESLIFNVIGFVFFCGELTICNEAILNVPNINNELIQDSAKIMFIKPKTQSLR